MYQIKINEDILFYFNKKTINNSQLSHIYNIINCSLFSYQKSIND